MDVVDLKLVFKRNRDAKACQAALDLQGYSELDARSRNRR